MASVTVQTSKPKPKGALIAALVFLLLGIAGCGYAAAKTVPYISDVVDFATDVGKVNSMVPMGQELTFTSSGSDGIVLLTSEAVCSGEGSGGAISFEGYQSFGPGTNVELGGAQISGYILFRTDSGTDYRVRCGDASSVGSYTATTAPGFLVDGAPGFFGGIGAGLLGSLFVIIAIILFIVGLVQRSSWKKRQQQPAYATQPGYPAGGAPPAPGQPAPGYGQAPPSSTPYQPPPLPPQQQPPTAPPPPQQQPPTSPPPPQQQPPTSPPPPPPPSGDEPPAPPPLR